MQAAGVKILEIRSWILQFAVEVSGKYDSSRDYRTALTKKLFEGSEGYIISVALIVSLVESLHPAKWCGRGEFGKEEQQSSVTHTWLNSER